MDKLHSLLNRQIQKHFGDVNSIPGSISEFVESVNQAYWQADSDRNMLERSLELSSQELVQNNSEMQAIIEALPDLLLHIDHNGIILKIKRETDSDVWYSLEPYVGKHIREFPFLKLDEEFENTVSAFQKPGAKRSSEYSVILGGITHYYEARYIPVMKNQLMILIRNITAMRNAQNNLNKSLSVLQATLDSTSSGILVLSTSGSILEYNRRFLEMWQISENDFNTSTNTDILQHITGPLSEPEIWLKRILEIESAAQAVSFDDLLFDDGRVLEWYSMPQYFEDQHIGCVWSFTDVTRLKLAEQNQRQQTEFLRNVIDANPNLIFVKDWDGRFSLVNRAVADLYGTTIAKMTGRLESEINKNQSEVQYFLETDREVMTSRLKKFIAQESVTNATTGEKRWFQTTKIPLIAADGSCRELLGIASDITERKRFEDKQAKLLAELEEVSKAKSQFLANMSHEVRTPMNGVYGMLTLAMETALTEEQFEYLYSAKLSAEDMLVIINDILDFSKIEAGKLDLTPTEFDLRDAVAQTIKQIYGSANEKDLDLIYWIDKEIPDVVIGDPGRLKQVLKNLLGNAIKFTPCGCIVLQIWQDAVEDDSICLKFAITDTGIGIPADKQKQVFEAFAQADGSTTRVYGGTGLGLAISLQLVQRMEGEIWIESPSRSILLPDDNTGKLVYDLTKSFRKRVGTEPEEQSFEGTTFYFTARFNKSRVQATTELQKRTAALCGKRVLVIGDEDITQKILNQDLRSWGMDVIIAAPGEASIRAAETEGQQCQLIILDTQFCGSDRIDLDTLMSRGLSGNKIPLILLYTHKSRQDVEKYREVPGITLFKKPASYQDLLLAISGILRTATGGRQTESNDLGREDSMMLPADRAGKPLQLEPFARKLQILLAEDNPINQKLATRILEKLGHEVKVAGNGFEAIRELRESAFDLILMDIHMPEMDGLEATGVIRDSEKGTKNHIPIIALTANAMQGDRERFLQAGMDEYVSKPIKKPELIAAIQQTIR